jgi:hypothetical protein
VAGGAEDQGVARILPLHRAGEHDAVGHGGFQVLQAVDGEIHPPVQQRLVDFLGEQAFAADIGQPSVLHGVAGGADDVFLEHVHPPQHRAELADLCQERPRLPQRERRAARADTQRHAPVVARHVRRCSPVR